MPRPQPPSCDSPAAEVVASGSELPREVWCLVVKKAVCGKAVRLACKALREAFDANVAT